MQPPDPSDLAAGRMLVNLDRWEFFDPSTAARDLVGDVRSVRTMIESPWHSQVMTAATHLLLRMRQVVDGNTIPPHDYGPNDIRTEPHPSVEHMDRYPGMMWGGKIYLSEKIVGSWEGDRIAIVSDSERVSNRLTAICHARGIVDPAALFDLCLPMKQVDSPHARVNREDLIRARFGDHVIPMNDLPPPWLKDITWDLMPAMERLMGLVFVAEGTINRSPETGWSALSNLYPMGTEHRHVAYTVRDELLAPIPPKSRLRFNDAEDPTPATVVRGSKRLMGW